MFLTVNFAFGFAATLGILVCGQVSGKQSYLLIQYYYRCMGTNTSFALHFPAKFNLQDLILTCRAHCIESAFRSLCVYLGNVIVIYVDGLMYSNTVIIYACRWPSEPRSDLFPVSARKRALEKVPHVLPLSDNRSLFWCCSHFWHVLR